MKLSLDISVRDLQDLAQEGKISVNIENRLVDLHQKQLKNKFGYMNYNNFATSGFLIEEVDRLFSRDIQISGFERTCFSMHFMLDGFLGHKFKNKDISIEGCKNYAGYINLDNLKHVYDKQNLYSKFIMIEVKDKTMLELANKYPDSFSDVYYNYLKGDTFFVNNDSQQTTTPDMLHAISQIRNSWLLGSANDIYRESKILELLSLQLQQGKETIIDINQNGCNSIGEFEKIHEAKRLLLADMNNTPTIPELSRHVGLNECKLKYGFRKVYNQTVFECLYDFKMVLARKLLLDTDKTVLEIAFECGYGDASNFAASFKRKYGVTPKQFRKRA